MGQRNAKTECSFCRKSYRDVSPLVEGPGEIYICGECVQLCQSIIDQEKRRRDSSIRSASPAPGKESIRAKLDQLVNGQDDAKEALVWAAHCPREGTGHVLLIGPGRSSKIFLAHALAHALEVPFGCWRFERVCQIQVRRG
jgi:ATP-dependent Clp protease ATP-binding subunit ClpX